MTDEGPLGKRVLVVDDDVILRDVLSLTLGAAGYDVLVAESGEDALRVLPAERDRVSIVLTDMHMPGMNGAMLAEKLKAAAAPGTVVVGMSGSQPTMEEQAAFRAFLEKPFSAEAFSEAVERAQSDRPRAELKTSLAAQAPVLNENIYARMAAIMPGPQLRELYRMTLEDVRRRVGLMRDAAARKDAETCRSEAHAVKGGCGMVGAAELGALAAEVERSLEPHLATLTDFDAACTRLEDMLDARTRTTGPITDGE